MLMFLGWHLKKSSGHSVTDEQFNIFKKIERAEFDTLFFFSV